MVVIRLEFRTYARIDTMLECHALARCIAFIEQISITEISLK